MRVVNMTTNLNCISIEYVLWGRSECFIPQTFIEDSQKVGGRKLRVKFDAIFLPLYTGIIGTQFSLGCRWVMISALNGVHPQRQSTFDGLETTARGYDIQLDFSAIDSRIRTHARVCGRSPNRKAYYTMMILELCVTGAQHQVNEGDWIPGAAKGPTSGKQKYDTCHACMMMQCSVTLRFSVSIGQHVDTAA
jgi:hypothetical protein